MFKDGMVVKILNGEFKDRMLQVQPSMIKNNGQWVVLDDIAINFNDVKPVDVDVFGVLGTIMVDVGEKLKQIDERVNKGYVAEKDLTIALIGMVSIGVGIKEASDSIMTMTGMDEGFEEFKKTMGEGILDKLINDMEKSECDCKTCTFTDLCKDDKNIGRKKK